MHLTIIAKSPVPGLVKTRLCPPCTPRQAAEVAHAAFADTIAAVDAAADEIGGNVDKVLLLDGEVQSWMPHDYDIVPQSDGDLGERQNHGFATHGRGLIVGMDTPAAARRLSGAARALTAGDDVVGMATDGGYWVIGLAHPSGEEFDGVPMSASNTGLAQIRRLHQLGRRVHLVAMARDVDDVADLRAIAESGDTGRLPTIARQVLTPAP